MKDYSKFGVQDHAGKLFGTTTGKAVWHTDGKGNYWCGSWHTRTPKQLLRECRSIIPDLLKNHPELR